VGAGVPAEQVTKENEKQRPQRTVAAVIDHPLDVRAGRKEAGNHRASTARLQKSGRPGLAEFLALQLEQGAGEFERLAGLDAI